MDVTKDAMMALTGQISEKDAVEMLGSSSI